MQNNNCGNKKTPKNTGTEISIKIPSPAQYQSNRKYSKSVIENKITDKIISIIFFVDCLIEVSPFFFCQLSANTKKLIVYCNINITHVIRTIIVNYAYLHQSTCTTYINLHRQVTDWHTIITV